MEDQEEFGKQSTTMTMTTIKGKRTKRPRAAPVISHLPGPTTSSAENGVVSAASSSDNTHATSAGSTTEEEEDMAHCLILLAQGHDHHHHHHPEQQPIIKHVGIHSSGGSSNDVVYQCKTCDRCFPSFQALGGHRASHKKPKPNTEAASFDDRSLFATSTALSLQVVSPSRGVLGTKGNAGNGNGNGNNGVKVSKVHECSICGAEFTSGQALGGHMRRHRTTSFMNPTATALISSSTNSSESSKKEGSGSRNVLELDLNLPAPEERATKFPFAAAGAGKEQVIVFSASPLVDCHY